ncbi:hypothetical protein O988_01532 [Pseudogymnoascus sp. VKM F-3808]|nr:hypothetical protein O988_01532 [Pseudogymnoascus sp. VKM F-3808]
MPAPATEKLSTALYTSDDDLKKTKERLMAAKDLGHWKEPNLTAGYERLLAHNDDAPVYKPLSDFIQQNQAPQPAPEQPHQSLHVPFYSPQITRAVEFIYNAIPESQMPYCLPGDIVDGGKTHSDVVYQTEVRDKARLLTKGVMERSFNVACSIINKHLDDATLKNSLQTALKASPQAQMKFFCNLLEDAHFFYLYSESFKCISFEFITHPRPRYDEAEELIPTNLSKIMRIKTGLLLFNWYRFTIQSAPDRASLEKNGAGIG